MPDTASIIKINGVEMPVPSEFSPLYKDYDSENSGRSETMHMTRDIVRTDVRRVTFKWKLQTPDLRVLVAAIKPPSITLTFFDINNPANSAYSNITCYADPSREPVLLFWDKTDPEKSWWEITVAFVEY